MVTYLDICVGQHYMLDLPETDAPILAEFTKEMRDGQLKFCREGTDRDIYLDIDDFERMRSDGRANRITLNSHGEIVGERDIDPLCLLDPDDPTITLKERENRLRQQERLKKARTLRFYVKKYDENPSVGRGRVALRKFIAEHKAEALHHGFSWAPSPSTLLRSIDQHGSMNERRLTSFFKERLENDRNYRWPKEILEAANRAIEYYWSDSKISMGRALDQFRAEAGQVTHNYHTTGYDSKGNLPVPCDETVRLWIRKEATWWNWAQRYDVENANRRFRGRGRAIEASRPLEYVMMDHTEIDAWSVVLDDNEDPIFVSRAWLTLAVDCYSRMVLGASLSYEPPSIHSVTACLKQVVRRNDKLIDLYGDHKGATDGWGRPFSVIVDNGKEFVSPSFQVACEAAGIDVVWAPIKTPMFKAYVERLYGTINTILWHDLPGGLPLTPQQRQQLNLSPQAEAAYTVGQLEEAFWNAIITLYHVEPHSGIGMAPALKWRKGIATHKRATVDDVSMLAKIMGRSRMVQLSAEGVRIDGHRFHDQKITTRLMNDLVYRGKERQQRRSMTSSRTIQVKATWDPGDVSKVYIWNPTTARSTMLPNWDASFASDLSWHAAQKIREFAKQRNLAFHSDQERAEARIAHRNFLLDIMPNLKAMERRRRARIIEPLKELPSGDRVEFRYVDDADNIPHDTPVRRTNHDPAAPKGRPFGGKRGARKAQKTRRRNAEKKASVEATERQYSQPTNKVKMPELSIGQDRIADIQARVSERVQKSKGGPR